MSLMRILSLLLMLWFAWTMIRSFINKQRWRAEVKREQGKVPATARIVKCEHCGVHLPEREAIDRGDEWYCSRDHALAHRRGADGS